MTRFVASVALAIVLIGPVYAQDPIQEHPRQPNQPVPFEGTAVYTTSASKAASLPDPVLENVAPAGTAAQCRD